jgi:hypothetical protein
MAFAELGRIAIEVGDLRSFAGDLERMFGMEFNVLDIPALGIIAGVGQDGLELVERTVAEPETAKYWRSPLCAVLLAVDDLEEAADRMKAGGFRLVQTAVTASGFRELFYGDSFHGIPLVLYQKDEAHLLHAPATGEPVFDDDPAGVPPRAAHARGAE